MVFIVRKQPSALGQLCMCHHPASALPQPQPLSLYPPPSRALALSAVDALHKTLNPQLPHSVLMLQAPNAPCSLPSYNTYEAVLQNWVNPLQHIKGSDILILFMWKPAVSQLNLDSALKVKWKKSPSCTVIQTVLTAYFCTCHHFHDLSCLAFSAFSNSCLTHYWWCICCW